MGAVRCITFDLDDLGSGTATSGDDYTAIAANAPRLMNERREMLSRMLFSWVVRCWRCGRG